MVSKMLTLETRYVHISIFLLKVFENKFFLHFDAKFFSNIMWEPLAICTSSFHRDGRIYISYPRLYLRVRKVCLCVCKSKRREKRYREFHEFGQAKFAYGSSILGSSQFTLLSKNDARFKSGQNWLKNNHLTSLIQIRDTLYIKREKRYWQNSACWMYEFKQNWSGSFNTSFKTESKYLDQYWSFFCISL